jgi:hypothetical protein
LSGGSHSRYTPVAALIGAAFGATLLQTAATLLGTFARGSLRLSPLRLVDSIGGLVLGAAAGLALVWVLGAVALLVPGQSRLRESAQRSRILSRLNDAVPPRTLLNALARIDPIRSLVGPSPPPAPDPSVLRTQAIRSAAPSVVRVLGTACGLGVEGTGWVVRTGLVVTAAHVVAGERDTVVQVAGTDASLPAEPVVFDAHNDIAVLRVSGLDVPALRLGVTRAGASAVLLGYPGNGPLKSIPLRIGRTQVVISTDTFDRRVIREITAVSGDIRHGDSGAPAIDGSGAVQATIFAARRGSKSGFAVPSYLVRRDLGRVGGPVSTEGCAT